MQKSMGLKYESVSEPLRSSVTYRVTSLIRNCPPPRTTIGP